MKTTSDLRNTQNYIWAMGTGKNPVTTRLMSSVDNIIIRETYNPVENKKENIMLMDKIRTIINRYCDAGIIIANKQIKTIVGYIVQIELPDRFNTEWGVAKIKQINKKLKEMIKCAEVKIIRHRYQDYLWIIYK